ncbi:MAG: hypothetical protein IMW96_07390 [Thermoanaerobacteraceae bacterium]|nr:hypothetical protein [Thermoanaerobacteraceae bacterium]
MLQVKFGHGVLLVEGPAAPWWVAYVLLGGMAAEMGRPPALVRTDIGGAMMAVGLIFTLMGWARLITRWRFFFYPPHHRLREEGGLRGTFIIGLSLLSGVGVMLLPASYWARVPAWAAGALSNAVIVGPLAGILLEHVVLREKGERSRAT